jgi:hypothetical protein
MIFDNLRQKVKKNIPNVANNYIVFFESFELEDQTIFNVISIILQNNVLCQITPIPFREPTNYYLIL